jgi:hypothetical protein
VLSWMRYPGRLAHLTTRSDAIVEAGAQVGVVWGTACGRSLRVFWDPGRTWQADWISPVDLRAETPRGWCLKCAYWAALDALVLEDYGYEAFKDAIAQGRVPTLARVA